MLWFLNFVMAYQVIPRRYRPERFCEVVGEDHIVRTLKNELISGKIPQSLLFAGPRGVGKTSLARIFAKAINCENKKLPEPCNACKACNEIKRGIFPDVIEIDGASNTGVENIREIKDNIYYKPIKGRYKVYIIDEVHMLSTSAFNALLKLIEEPPSHIVFIFATTELTKVPKTVISRCQCFEFRKLPEKLIAENLKLIAEKENIEISEKALFQIAKLSSGSLRDAQMMLEQAASFYEGKIQDVFELFGKSSCDRLCEAILSGDVKTTLSEISALFYKGCDPKDIYSSLLAEFVERVKKESENPDRALEFLPYLNLFLNHTDTVIRSPFPDTCLEILSTIAAYLPKISSWQKVAEKILEIEERISTSFKSRLKDTPLIKEKTLPKKEEKELIKEESKEALDDMWLSFLSFLEKEVPSFLPFFKRAKIEKENGQKRLCAKKGDRFFFEANKEKIKTLFRQFFGETALEIVYLDNNFDSENSYSLALKNKVLKDIIEVLGGEIVEIKRREEI